MDLGQPSSYLLLEPGADVVSSDGVHVGTVKQVLFDADEDIFDGIFIDTQPRPGGPRFVDAPEVDRIYERGAVLKIAAADVDDLPTSRR